MSKQKALEIKTVCFFPYFKGGDDFGEYLEDHKDSAYDALVEWGGDMIVAGKAILRAAEAMKGETVHDVQGDTHSATVSLDADVADRVVKQADGAGVEIEVDVEDEAASI